MWSSNRPGVATMMSGVTERVFTLVLHVVSAVKRGCLEAAGYFADYGGNLHHKLTRRGL